ncbi:MAG TPA: hypothetical protein VEA99_13975 [Gemmatimonadaceae bacterium]|nr:hypothetical protein [Gemmatimonadaceae bacterium]
MPVSTPIRPSGAFSAVPAPGEAIVPPGFAHPRLRLVTAQGRQIVLFDLRGMHDEAEAVALIEGPYSRFMDAQRPGAGLLTMVETRDTPTSPSTVNALRDFAHRNAPFVAASAVVAERPMHRLAVTTIAMFTKRRIKAFADDGEAAAWLVTQ